MKLSDRIVLLLVLSVFFIGITNLLISLNQEKGIFADSEKILIQSISEVLSETLVDDVIDGNKLKVTSSFKKLKNNLEVIEFLYVTDVDGSIFAHSFEKGFPASLLHKDTEHKFNGNIMLRANYQMNKHEVHAYDVMLIPGFDSILHIGINQKSVTANLSDNFQNGAILNIIVILLVLLLAFYLSRKIITPLTLLTEKVKASGKDGVVDISGIENTSPEIHLLADSFYNATLARQQALDELKEREQNLEITLNSIGDAVIATDKQGNVTRMNPVAEMLTGWQLQEARGKSVKTIFPIVNASTREEITNPVEKVLQTGETVYLSNHTTLIAKNGVEYQIADSAAPIRDNNNNILGMVLIFNDVTEQYRLRESLRTSAQRLQLYREQSALAVIEWNTDFQVVDWNPAAEKIFGYRFAEVKGRNVAAIMVPEKGIDEVQNVWAELMNQSGGEVNINENLTKDNQVILCEWHNTPLKDEDGNIIGVVSTVQDITERESREEQLRRTQKMDALGKLTGGIAHDYNNMLGIILGYVEMLGEEINQQPKLQEYVDEIRHAGERGAELTKRLLNFSRYQIGKADALNLNNLLCDSQQMLEKTLTARIKVVMDLADDLWTTWLDKGDMEDVIINMSINAMHAIDGHGDLTFHTENISLDERDVEYLKLIPGDYVLLSISDTGRGMDEVTKEKLFDPFYSTKGDGGTGLGLSQVYGFVERSRGAIKVSSQLCKGSRFTLYFPRYQTSKSTINSEAKRQLTDYSGSETILVVDDEPVLVKLASQILSRYGYQVIAADSAKQALALLETNPVDLIVSDIIMPEMDGYQLSAIVRKKYPDIKIQLASGFSDERNVNMVDEKLQKDILYKPYKAEDLLKKIREVLDRSSH